MKSIVLTLSLFIILILNACQPTTVTLQPSGPVSVELDKPFILSLQQGKDTAVSPSSMSVKIVEINDSRCPTGVECIWAGMVQVTLEVSEPDKDMQKLILTLGGTSADDQISAPVTEGYLSLQSVEPYPVSGQTVSKDQLIVTLILTKDPIG